ncbi:MAG TPA: DUF4159 domain-containing protein [Fuerstia sp.]|nr:DUF4159 domain-containing protein [Fuerstiella sp.]
MFRSRKIRVIFATCLLLCWGTCWHNSPADSDRTVTNPPQDADAFTFVRIKYDSTGGYGESWYRHEGRDWDRWETDYPRAETELTSVRVNPEPIVLRLTDTELFDHPFVFMSDVGWMQLSSVERVMLERYLSAGGFLWIDDFWGEAEWQNMDRNIGGLRNDWKWKAIPNDHAILQTVYRLKECPQVPARIFFVQTGRNWDPPEVHRGPTGGVEGVRHVRLMGLFDTRGRLMAVATHNTDIADGWEREGESKEFFDRFSVHSYAMAINVLFYAMTH